MSTERRLERIAGSVEARSVLMGTASEHNGVVLTTDAGEHLRLQRVGGNPFRDTLTESLTGRKVTVEGYRLGDIFRYTQIFD